MKSGKICCKNTKQLFIAKSIVDNLPGGLLACWGVLYTPVLNTPLIDKFDTTFEDFIKGWYSDISGQDYI